MDTTTQFYNQKLFKITLFIFFMKEDSNPEKVLKEAVRKVTKDSGYIRIDGVNIRAEYYYNPKNRHESVTLVPAEISSKRSVYYDMDVKFPYISHDVDNKYVEVNKVTWLDRINPVGPIIPQNYKQLNKATKLIKDESKRLLKSKRNLEKSVNYFAAIVIIKIIAGGLFFLSSNITGTL